VSARVVGAGLAGRRENRATTRFNATHAPVADGLKNTSSSRITLGCRSRLRMHTSRSTRLALSSDASTSGMRLSATS